MTDNEFDDIFKKRLREHEGDIPAGMWQRIDTGKRKRRGGYIWIYLAAVLLLSIFATGIYRFYAGTNNPNSNNHIITDAKNKTNSFNKVDTVISKNETDSSLNNNVAGLTPHSKKINTVEKYYRQRLAKKQNDRNYNDQSSSKNIVDDLTKMQRSNPEMLDHGITDTAKITTQKKPANKEIATDESDDDNTEQNVEYDKLAIQFFVSPDIPFSTIHSSNKDYEKMLSDNISMKLSYTIGAAVSFAINKRIALLAGIQYSRVNETVSAIDSVMGAYKRSNHLSFINMPLTISYRTKWTKTFQTSLKAGILLNVSSSYSGSMPDAYGDFTDISQDVYESNTATSIYTAVNFAKPVSKNLDVFAEPYFRWQTKNMVNGIQPFTRKINTAGLALGIQWRLLKDENK